MTVFSLLLPHLAFLGNVFLSFLKKGVDGAHLFELESQMPVAVTYVCTYIQKDAGGRHVVDILVEIVEMDMPAIPPRFDGIVAEEESAEDGEYEGDCGDIDKILYEAVAVDSVERQPWVHGKVKYVCGK